MPVQLSSHVSLAPTALVRKLDNESVLLDLNSEQYYGLDDVGTRILDALCEAGSPEAAAQQLIDEYDVAIGDLREDILELADKLIERGLLLVDN